MKKTKNNLFPIISSIVFEECNFLSWTVEKQLYIYVDPTWRNEYINAFALDCFSGLVTPTELTVFAAQNQKKLYIPEYNLISIALVFSYNLKLRVGFVCVHTNKIDEAPRTLEFLMPGFNWAEREASEMFGLSFFGKKDSRSLLLDYSDNNTPLCKEFPCAGISNVRFDVFNQQVVRSQVL